MQVQIERVLQFVEEIRGFGGSPDKGVNRLAYSDEDMAAQEYVIKILIELGCSVRRDAIGNIFARLPGREELPAIAGGSHLDSVKQAGHLDGVLGVAGMLEVLRLAKQKGGLRHPLELIIFMAEESTRFGFATVGSKLMAGKGTPEGFSKATKHGEKSYIQVLQERGFAPEDYLSVRLNPVGYKAFFELHIEQGRVLADTGNVVGIVENIAAPTRMKIIVEGMADHSGATPMGFRKDALVSAARMIVQIEAVAKKYEDKGIVATVGVVDIEPGSINVIPGKVALWTDLRGVTEDSINVAVTELQEKVKEVAAADSINISVDVLTADKPVALSEELAKISESVCNLNRIKYLRMNSGAGHDAMHMADLMPTTMLFVPSVEGISHNPAEYTSNDDIAVGVKVLWETIKELDRR